MPENETICPRECDAGFSELAFRGVNRCAMLVQELTVP